MDRGRKGIIRKIEDSFVDYSHFEAAYFKEQFNVELDASGYAMGAVLSQKGGAIAFFNK